MTPLLDLGRGRCCLEDRIYTKSPTIISLVPITYVLEYIIVWDNCFLFIVCFVFYIKTLKTLKKYEKEFAEDMNKLSTEKREKILINSKIASKILSAYNKTI